MGKFLDDKKYAEVWKNREVDRSAYRDAFSGKGIISESLRRSAEFQEVLTKINDNYMHPNPDYTVRDIELEEIDSDTQGLWLHFFDSNADIHRAHLLAYLNLLDQVRLSIVHLVVKLFGSHDGRENKIPQVDKVFHEAALNLAQSNPQCDAILKELGLWHLEV